MRRAGRPSNSNRNRDRNQRRAAYDPLDDYRPGAPAYDPLMYTPLLQQPQPPRALYTLWGEHVERELLQLMYGGGDVDAADADVPLYRVLPLLGTVYGAAAAAAGGSSSSSSILSRYRIDFDLWAKIDRELFASEDYGALADIGNDVDADGRPLPAQGWGMLQPELRCAVNTWSGARLDVCPLYKYRSLEESSRAVYLTLQYMFFQVRNGIYVQIRNGKVRVFAPFHNLEPEFVNTWTGARPRAPPVDTAAAAAAGHRSSSSSASASPSLNLRALLDDSNGNERGAGARPREYYAQKRLEWGAAMCRGDDGVLLDVRQWWANAYVVDNVPQPRHGGWSAAKNAELEDMLRATCEAVFVPDCDFFLNKRDFPHLHYNVGAQRLSEPYPFLYGSMDAKQHTRLSPPAGVGYDEHSRFAPIFSFAGGADFADLLMPTPEDWRLATGEDEDVGGTTRLGHPECFAFEAKTGPKAPLAVWRGSATGPGVTCDDNQRLALARLARTPSVAAAGVLDCKLTGVNLRDRVCADGHVRYISLATAREATGCDTVEQLARLRKTNHLSFMDQCAYRYWIYVQGHSAAFRYSKMMFSHSVILRVQSTVAAPDLWFFPCLRGAEPTAAAAAGAANSAEDIAEADHLVVRADLSDLLEVIDWCELHPRECARIARNAYSLAEQLFCRNFILQYWHNLLVKTHLNQRHFLTEFVACRPPPPSSSSAPFHGR